MHNTVPQMGYYHRGLGAFIYDEDRIPQMGQWGQANNAGQMGGFNDILNALVKGAEQTGKSPQATQILNNFIQTGSIDLSALQDPAMANVYAELMKVPDFAAAESKAISTGIQNKTAQFTKTLTDTVNQYKNQIMLVSALGVAAALYFYFRKK